VIRPVHHGLRADRQQDRLVGRRCLPRRRPLRGRRHAGAPDARAEGEHEVHVDPCGAFNNKFATLGAAALGVTFPSQWEPHVAYKPQFGPTVPEFIKAFEAQYHMVPDYHAASGYAVGLILQHAIETAGSLDTKKVAAALDAMNVTTFYGPMKVTTDAKNHGLQVGHTMVLGQWQKDKDGKLVKQIVFPANAASAKMLYPIPATN